MKKLALASLLLLSAAAPANALTWKEFWEPFEGHGHYHSHHYYYEAPPRRRMCEVQVTRRVWVPGRWLGHYEYVEGYWEKQTRLKYRPCRR
jgi:hypothetical protein